MVSALDADVLEKDGKVQIGLAASQKIPLCSESIDFVLSSPPYCTRIDYASATRVELAVLGLSQVLDPWNGSGTTTAVTAGKGNPGFGFDLNPVMAVVARARLLNKRERPSLMPLAKYITKLAIDIPSVQIEDPLLFWFKPNSAGFLRQLEFGLQSSLLGLEAWTPMERHIQSKEFSDIAAFFYVALFRTARTLLTRFQSSNPTWIKGPKSYSAIR